MKSNGARHAPKRSSLYSDIANINSFKDKCPVFVSSGAKYEVALFTHDAEQTRHFHKQGTEIYTVLEGEMAIDARI